MSRQYIGGPYFKVSGMRGVSILRNVVWDTKGNLIQEDYMTVNIIKTISYRTSPGDRSLTFPYESAFTTMGYTIEDDKVCIVFKGDSYKIDKVKVALEGGTYKVAAVKRTKTAEKVHENKILAEFGDYIIVMGEKI